jgi:hypothetical protein
MPPDARELLLHRASSAKSADERLFRRSGLAVQSAALNKGRLQPRKRIRLRIVFLDDGQARWNLPAPQCNPMLLQPKGRAPMRG